MKDIIKTVRLFGGDRGTNVVLLRALTLDDVNIDVKTIEATHERPDDAVTSVILTMRSEDLPVLAEAVGAKTYRNEGDDEDQPLRLSNYHALNGLSSAWDLVPAIFSQRARFKTNYARKKTDASRDNCLEEANAKANSVDVEQMKVMALAEMNEALERLVSNRSKEVKDAAARILGDRNVNEEWLEQAIAADDTIDESLYKQTNADIESVEKEIDALEDKLAELKKLRKVTERTVIRKSMLKKAEGDDSTIQMIESIQPEESPSFRFR